MRVLSTRRQLLVILNLFRMKSRFLPCSVAGSALNHTRLHSPKEYVLLVPASSPESKLTRKVKLRVMIKILSTSAVMKSQFSHIIQVDTPVAVKHHNRSMEAKHSISRTQPSRSSPSMSLIPGVRSLTNPSMASQLLSLVQFSLPSLFPADGKQ